jgi:hypothetical protein
LDKDAYLSKGFAIQAAEYFSAGRRSVASVVPNDDFTLNLTFDNGEIRIYDVKPMIDGAASFLADPRNFRRAYLDENGCVAWDIDPAVDSGTVWSNKIDICRDRCYLDSRPIV